MASTKTRDALHVVLSEETNLEHRQRQAIVTALTQRFSFIDNEETPTVLVERYKQISDTLLARRIELRISQGYRLVTLNTVGRGATALAVYQKTE